MLESSCYGASLRICLTNSILYFLSFKSMTVNDGNMSSICCDNYWKWKADDSFLMHGRQANCMHEDKFEFLTAGVLNLGHLHVPYGM